MIREILLEEIQKDINQVRFYKDNYYPVKSLFALRAVVELHKPKHFIDNDEVYCSCSLSQLIAYPCPTIQAIKEELE